VRDLWGGDSHGGCSGADNLAAALEVHLTRLDYGGVGGGRGDDAWGGLGDWFERGVEGGFTHGLGIDEGDDDRPGEECTAGKFSLSY